MTEPTITVTVDPVATPDGGRDYLLVVTINGRKIAKCGRIYGTREVPTATIAEAIRAAREQAT